MVNTKPKNYWLHEANRKLVLALIAAKGKCRRLINEAIECLDKHERKLNAKDSDTHTC